MKKNLDLCSRRNFIGGTVTALSSSHFPLGAKSLERSNRPVGPESLHAFANEAQITPSFFQLQPGAVLPRGWLLDWANSAANGITGHLDEYCATFGQAWKGFGFEARGANPDGTGWPLEQCSYWLDGAIRLAYQLDDRKLIEKIQTRLNFVVNGILNGGDSFIYWRPGSVLDSNFNSWAHSHMGRALVAYYQASGDPRILDALVSVYRKFPLPKLGDDFTNVSGAVNIDPMMDAFLMSGDRAILSNVRRFVESDSYTATRSNFLANRIPVGHDVIFYENIRVPALLYPWTGERADLAATLQAVQYSDMRYGLPVGIGSGEEWQAGIGSTRNIETCNVAASMWSFLCLSRVTGEASYSDRIEKIFFNAAPAPVSRDFITMSYYQSMNRYGADLPLQEPKNPGLNAYKFTKIGHPVLCCVGNLNRLIPNYVMHMWMATPDAGLAAVLYGPSLVRTSVKSGVQIEIESQTAYPFEESIELKVRPQIPVVFPLYLRVPEWCRNPEIAVNGERFLGRLDAKGFIQVNRRWNKGDSVTLRFPMSVRIVTGRETSYPPVKYFANSRAIAKLPGIRNPYACVYYGPLLFSFPIRDRNPDQEEPGQNFHYALAMTSKSPGPNDVAVIRHPMPAHWDWSLNSPVELRVKAQKFDWRPTEVQPIPQEPVKDGAPVEASLAPYGCAKFRVTMFPVTEQLWKALGPG